ncbi:MAG: hypothetical protein KJO35_06990, partial [Gammaproteobacteria bacterium]|nr:hypothetical protein [Gammaproteobacteria bacterium]
SQLSSLRDGMAFFGNDPYHEGFRDRLIDQLEYYYRNLVAVPVPAAQKVWLRLAQFRGNLLQGVEDLYAHLGITMTTKYRNELIAAASIASRYDSSHQYELSEFGLSAEGLHKKFADSISELGLNQSAGDGA